MKALFAEQGIQKEKELILYCHIGMQLTVVYTAAKILGFRNIRVYDGSFHEWGPSSYPVEVE
jgi:thiosulfate/3-mercaptopyruvate sulfurtransferase